MEEKIGTKEGEATFRPKPFIPRKFQPFSQLSEPFVAPNSLHDQTNATLMELVRDLKDERQNIILPLRSNKTS